MVSRLSFRSSGKDVKLRPKVTTFFRRLPSAVLKIVTTNLLGLVTFCHLLGQTAIEEIIMRRHAHERALRLPPCYADPARNRSAPRTRVVPIGKINEQASDDQCFLRYVTRVLDNGTIVLPAISRHMYFCRLR
jgi:hypothetical protein